ncbi:Uncharacterised protein [Vibrio anguillarum]|nr:Uncharacterised protein [Vibrio anguillarum]
MIFRQLKSLTEHIDVTVVCPDMLSEGWSFGIPEPLFGYTKLHQIYTKAKVDYSGRVTVPVLWDKKTNTIVSNESSEIIRMFNSAFNELTGNQHDYYPQALSKAIDEWNAYIYPNINNGVYRCGFATTQEAYDDAYDALFTALDKVNNHLATYRYLVVTRSPRRIGVYSLHLSVLMLFTSGHFKCNKQRIADYENLSGYLKELYQIDRYQTNDRFLPHQTPLLFQPYRY